MSNKNAIVVEGLSKLYKVGKKHDPTLRGTLKGLFRPNHKTKDFWALQEINFQIEKGEAVGIIGRNGAGKSTLLKILSKITYPTTGQAKIHGRVASLLEVGTGFHQELTGRENIYLNGSLLGMTRSEIKSKLDEIIEFSGIETFIDTPVKRYSSGMYVRLAFSVAAHLRTDIMIIDEILTVGDAEFQQKCLTKMGYTIQDGKTVLLVSHNADLIRKLSKRALLLDQGKLILDDNAETVLKEYGSTYMQDYKEYEDDFIHRITIIEKSPLILRVDFSNTKVPFIPMLTFIVHDENGKNVFGSSASFIPEKPDIDTSTNGSIEVTVQTPKLLSGDYFLSFWYGDGKNNYFKDENCLKFNVTSEDKYTKMGFLAPSVKFNYFKY